MKQRSISRQTKTKTKTKEIMCCNCGLSHYVKERSQDRLGWLSGKISPRSERIEVSNALLWYRIIVSDTSVA